MYSDNNNGLNQNNQVNHDGVVNNSLQNTNFNQNQTNNTMYSNNQQIGSNQSIKPPKKNNIGLIIGCVTIVIVASIVIGNKFLSSENILDINKDNISDKDNNLSQQENEIVNIDVSETYIERQIQYYLDVRYKVTTPTFLWDSNDNFWTAEIDTVLLPSKNGEIVENYYDIKELSGVYFQVRDDVVESESSLQKKFKDWLGINVIQVEDIEDDEFSRHIKGESESIYFESYCFSYDLYDEGEILTINYYIELLLYKDNYDNDFVRNIINEYHTIIDTFEFVK